MKELSIGKHISSVYRKQNIIINDICKDLDISSGQYLFLINIAENPNITQKHLSDKLHIDRANTNRAIKKLESLAYLTVVSDPEDNRNKCSTLTRLGLEKANLLKSRLSRITQVLTRGFTEDEVLIFSKLISSMQDNVHREVCLIKGANNGQT